MKRALFIAGPTAGGKSAFALKAASEYDGVIINADSMQVYRDLQVITACPSELEEQQAPHRLYRFLDGAKTCSAAFWAEHAMHQIEQAWAEDKLPILVGGTGMYFKVLLDGIARVPDIPDEIRQEVRRQCAEAGSAVLHTELQMSDPVIAKRLAPGDSQRICRAVEVERATGTPLSEWQKKTEPGPMQAHDIKGAVEKFILLPEREVLYERCNRRFDLMLEEGGLREVEALLERNLPRELPVMRALGVPSLIAYLEGNNSLEKASDDAKMQTRRFAKRQLTWFRNQFSHWNTLDAQYSESYFDNLVTKLFKK